MQATISNAITMIQDTPHLPCLYAGEERYYVKRLDDIRFHKDWTTSSNFRRQIEILEISEDWEEELKTEHDFRMDSLLRRHFCYHWLAALGMMYAHSASWSA